MYTPAIAGECCTECCPVAAAEAAQAAITIRDSESTHTANEAGHSSFNFPDETISYECCFRNPNYDASSLIPIGSTIVRQPSDSRQLSSPQRHKVTNKTCLPGDHNEIIETPNFLRLSTLQPTVITSDRAISEIPNRGVETINNRNSLIISQDMTQRKVMNSINEAIMNNTLIQTNNNNLLANINSESDNISASTTSTNFMTTSTSTSGIKRKQDMIFDGARCLWETCAAVFRSIDELIPHLSKLHIARRSNGISCRWASCSKEQENDDELFQHLCHDHLAARDLQHGCKWQGCYLRFETFEELTGHVSEGHIGCGRSQYVCYWERCDRNGRPFSQRQKVMRHIQTHTGKRCMIFYDIIKVLEFHTNIMTQHMRTHTGERPFKCPQPDCDREFSISGALTIHLRVHTDVAFIKRVEIVHEEAMALKDSLLNTISVNENIISDMKMEEVELANRNVSTDIVTTMNEKSVMPTLLHTHPISFDHNDQYLVLNRRYGVLNRVKSIDECQMDLSDNEFYDDKIIINRRKEITETNNTDYTLRTKGWIPKRNGIIQRMTSFDSDQTRIGSTTGFEDHEIIDSEISDEEQLPSKTFGYFSLYKPHETRTNYKVDDEFIMILSEENKVVKNTSETDSVEYDTDEEEVILVDSEQELLDKQFVRKKRTSTISESKTQELPYRYNQVNSPEFPTKETVSSCASSPPSPTFLPSHISLNISLHVPNTKLTSNNPDTKMSPWTSDEDKLLIDAVLESLAPSWVQISKNIMMQRSEDACRLRWARLKQRLYGSA
ncbi:16950_t:CDS:2 [Cetraspora pellucida]|uniref:16950_t:CDS:1 n=1 Tax=Cetraspora pellucida TaxID=1433469 RepID=A0A9N9DI04_9GLOM|nr:16950_t:CDS:2 [Cetraspora pellucida]